MVRACRLRRHAAALAGWCERVGFAATLPLGTRL